MKTYKTEVLATFPDTELKRETRVSDGVCTGVFPTNKDYCVFGADVIKGRYRFLLLKQERHEDDIYGNRSVVIGTTRIVGYCFPCEGLKLGETVEVKSVPLSCSFILTNTQTGAIVLTGKLEGLSLLDPRNVQLAMSQQELDPEPNVIVRERLPEATEEFLRHQMASRML